MVESEFIVQQTKSDRDETIKATIEQTFKELALLADSLVESAKAQTKTREEYIAFLKGAAFLFHSVCERDKKGLKKTGKGIETIQDAISHCNDLIPFMHEEDKAEHLQLMNWLNELLERRNAENYKTK
jgi:hypothetical protein